MSFPATRMRRMRKSESMRRLVCETEVLPAHLIYPLFVVEGRGIREPVGAMPGVERYSPDMLGQTIDRVRAEEIGGVLLFGIPAHKDSLGTSSFDDNGAVQQAVKKIKDQVPGLVVITDVCLCEYTDHGHCGRLDDRGRVDNDGTLGLLARQAVSHARAGADIVAPSDMMDGRIGHIRRSLDEEGFKDTAIMSYAAKFASAFYGPFREAAESAPRSGDRRAYQMDPPNVREAMREIELDIEEGADIIMVKPALPYLDVICRARQRFDLPLAAYNVSGEYSMIKAAAANGWIDGPRAALEALVAIKRAGADMIITYFALDLASVLK